MSITVTLNIERENTAEPECDLEETVRAVCEKVLETEGCPSDTEISLLLVGNDAIRRINRTTRGIDAVTDVLSFPNLSFVRSVDGKACPSDWTSAMSCAWDCVDPETGNLFLGDIVLNMDRVFLQAAEYGHSQRRELAFLIAHSMLHLCGYDHMTPDDETAMFTRQERILKELGIVREGTADRNG